MVEGEGVLQAIGGRMSVRPEPADVVDQHIQPWVSIENCAGEAAHLGLGAHVGCEHVDGRVSGSGTNVGGGLFGTDQVATRDADPGAHRGEPDRRGFADSARSAGDQHDLAGHRTVHQTLITTFPRAWPVPT